MHSIRLQVVHGVLRSNYCIVREGVEFESTFDALAVTARLGLSRESRATTRRPRAGHSLPRLRAGVCMWMIPRYRLAGADTHVE